MGDVPEKPKTIDELLAMAGDVAKEQGVTRKELLEDLSRKVKEAAQKRKAPPGKFRVLGVDKYDGTDWIEGDYDSRESALRIARKKTDEAKKNIVTSGSREMAGYNIATVFYAYDEQGGYLGGDTWKGE